MSTYIDREPWDLQTAIRTAHSDGLPEQVIEVTNLYQVAVDTFTGDLFLFPRNGDRIRIRFATPSVQAAVLGTFLDAMECRADVAFGAR